MKLDEKQPDRTMPPLPPGTRHRGYHVWSNLLFAHWRVSKELLQPLIPPQLTIDTFDGDAWVGLVPFHMSGVRPRGFPAVPGISSFHETNVRTYVHYRGGGCGVWFFSLDASNRLAVMLARRFWHLNYHLSRMTLTRNGDEISYRSNRCAGGAGCDIRAKIGDNYSPSPALPAISGEPRERATVSQVSSTSSTSLVGIKQSSAVLSHAPQDTLGHAAPGSLEHFLVERYLMYAARPNGQILQGRVRHTPYPLRHVEVTEFHETLLAVNQIPISTPPEHFLFSEGVTVDVFPLRPLD